MNFSAVILAGGKSSRMGCDKAWLQVGGQTLLARQVELARQTGAGEVFISGRPETDYSAVSCRILTDQYQNAGPLAGIERALATTPTSLLLVLAVDMPDMSVELLQRLAMEASENSGVIPKINGQFEPLVAFYPKASHTLATAQLEQGRFAVKDFAARCVQSGLAHIVELSASFEQHFNNWNSPADLQLPGDSSLLYSKPGATR